MSLEGRLRELDLAEVLQLLALGRKSGVLHLDSALDGARAAVQVRHGHVTNAEVWDAGDSVSTLRPRAADEAADVEAVMLDLLRWTEGGFRFTSDDDGETAGAAIRLPIEPLLIEAAERAAVWTRITDHIPHLRVVPAFVDLSGRPFSMLRLAPAQWEILTRIDGRRTVLMVARSLGRAPMEVAEQVHGMITAGLLVVRDAPVAPRKNPTPPATPAVRPVASHDLETSVGGGEAAGDAAGARATVWCQLGDEAARRGDLTGAMTHWQAALREPERFPGADRVREAIAVTARLHALLYP